MQRLRTNRHRDEDQKETTERASQNHLTEHEPRPRAGDQQLGQNSFMN
jgi:hypothetical protein